MSDLRFDVDTRQRAVNAFVEAAAALLKSPWPSDDDFAAALILGAYGVVQIRTLDHHGRARDLAVDVIQRLRARAKETG